MTHPTRDTRPSVPPLQEFEAFKRRVTYHGSLSLSPILPVTEHHIPHRGQNRRRVYRIASYAELLLSAVEGHRLGVIPNCGLARRVGSGQRDTDESGTRGYVDDAPCSC